MKDVARAVGAGVPIELGGRTIILSPLKLRDFGVISNYLSDKRKSAIEAVKPSLAGLTAEDRRFLLLQAMKDDALAYENLDIGLVMDFINTFDGLVWAVWLMAKREDSTITLEWVKESFEDMSLVEFQSIGEKVAMATAVDEVANVTGPPDETTAAGQNDA